MGWTTPRTWVSAEILTAALLNTHVRDNLNALGTWTAYTPTVTSETGTITTVGAHSAQYIIAGSTVLWQASIIITTNGTGATSVQFNLPTASSFGYIGSGREIASTGLALTVTATGSTAKVLTYANAYPGGSGYQLELGGLYKS